MARYLHRSPAGLMNARRIRRSSDPGDSGSNDKKPAEKVSDTRDLRPTTTPPTSGTRDRQAAYRIVVAHSNEEARRWLEGALRSVGSLDVAVSVVELDLKLALSPLDLVVTGSQLSDGSGLQVLARLRAGGGRTPFIVVTSLHRHVVRAFVSDMEGTVLSSRVLDAENLAELASNLIRALHGRKP